MLECQNTWICSNANFSKINLPSLESCYHRYCSWSYQDKDQFYDRYEPVLFMTVDDPICMMTRGRSILQSYLDYAEQLSSIPLSGLIQHDPIEMILVQSWFILWSSKADNQCISFAHAFRDRYMVEQVYKLHLDVSLSLYMIS